MEDTDLDGTCVICIERKGPNKIMGGWDMGERDGWIEMGERRWVRGNRDRNVKWKKVKRKSNAQRVKRRFVYLDISLLLRF